MASVNGCKTRIPIDAQFAELIVAEQGLNLEADERIP